MDDQKYLYFEKQQSALCAVHAINTLLGGPYYTEFDLAQIALELDSLERSLLYAAGPDHSSSLSPSYNVDESGNFSIAVIEKALANFSLIMTPVASLDLAGKEWWMSQMEEKDPLQQQAFICNLDQHWFTIKKVLGDWWDFNSVGPAPRHVSAFYVSTFLATLQKEGYSIFAIRGVLPDIQPDMLLSPQGQWFSPQEAKDVQKQSDTMKQEGYVKAAVSELLHKASAMGTKLVLQSRTKQKAHSQEFIDDELAHALAASLEDLEPQSMDGDGDDDDDEGLAAAIAASLEGHTQVLEVQDSPEGGKIALPDVGEEPPEGGEGVISLVLLLPSGERLLRRFHSQEDTVGHVVAYVLKTIPLPERKMPQLSSSFPKRVIGDLQSTLKDAGISNKEALRFEFVEPP